MQGNTHTLEFHSIKQVYGLFDAFKEQIERLQTENTELRKELTTTQHTLQSQNAGHETQITALNAQLSAAVNAANEATSQSSDGNKRGHTSRPASKLDSKSKSKSEQQRFDRFTSINKGKRSGGCSSKVC